MNKEKSSFLRPFVIDGPQCLFSATRKTESSQHLALPLISTSNEEEGDQACEACGQKHTDSSLILQCVASG